MQDKSMHENIASPTAKHRLFKITVIFYVNGNGGTRKQESRGDRNQAKMHYRRLFDYSYVRTTQ